MKHGPSDEIWTPKPYFVLPINKRRVQRNQPFISVPLYPSILQFCISPFVSTLLSLIARPSFCYFTTAVFYLLLTHLSLLAFWDGM